MRTGRLGIAVLLLAGLTIAAIACGGGSKKSTATPTKATAPSGTASGTSLTVNLAEYKILPDKASVRAGGVAFNVKNIGSATHELVVIRTDLAEDALPAKADGSVDETNAALTVIDETGDLSAGANKALAANLVAGKYVLICNLVEATGGTTHVHYALGMHTAFEVTP